MHTPHFSRSFRRAFTLVELLVVITIIAILASVSLVAFRSVKIRASRGAASTTMRSIGQSVEIYVSDNGGLYPGREGETPALDPVQTASVASPTQLATYLAEQLWESSMPASERAKQTILKEIVPKIALPFVQEPGGEARDLYFLYHVSTDETNPLPGPASIDPTTSVWGKKGGRISFNKAQVPMLSDIYLSAAWEDYKDEDTQTFWGDTFNILYFDGHGETLKASKFPWVEVIPGGGKQ
jgi:prepilin-type N-terminal cleavage/methylation domain-containing protein/prepilin-type processing-associated H-X9-DG protein